ncbi:type VI secretion system amidase effector protein Tae4 [Neptunomonas sp.]|uniref:type VI secretion system amidase effector protein Tae4 n=1 Tax=Neptunomonas sp. TaxID=1971898 RepID=UPI0025EB2501|nr:type VI secretion system amidase effector protein Tae4 [Neptunomonas sp.]
MNKLPKWNILKSHYPAQPAPTVFKQIGGKVELNFDMGIFGNACATRVSKALNGSGGLHLIPFYKAIGPNGKFEGQVSSGKNKRWYIFRVKILTKYLTEKYGKPDSYSPSEHISKLKNRKGIIVYEVNGWSDATGHADLWDGNKCVFKGYGSISHKVHFWETPQ